MFSVRGSRPGKTVQMSEAEVNAECRGAITFSGKFPQDMGKNHMKISEGLV